jgi:hypothetical protein
VYGDLGLLEALQGCLFAFDEHVDGVWADYTPSACQGPCRQRQGYIRRPALLVDADPWWSPLPC